MTSRQRSPARRGLGGLTSAALAVLGSLVLLAMGLWAAGYNPPAVLSALATGAFGSWYAITSATLLRSVPLIVIALGLAIGFRAGSFNIGGEGQFYAGAIAATWLGLHLGRLPSGLGIPLVWLVAALAGVLWIAVPVVLKVRFGVLEVITTLLLNFIAISLVSLMVTGPLQESRRTYPQSDPLPAGIRLPMLPGTRLHLGFLAALVLAVVLHVLFSRTLWGFNLLATGAGPKAAAISGRLPVKRIAAEALLWSGALAGLAGGIEITGVSYALFQNLSPGYGFSAIAVALLARLQPLGIVVTGVLFGALEAGAAAMQREAGVPAVVVNVLEALIIILVLIGDVLRRRAATNILLDEPA